MSKVDAKNMADYVLPLNMNGMHGRMMRVPSPSNKKREILLVYGHHASIERMFGFAEALSQYGGVTLPDLPGFGGMDTFFSIKEKPTIDNYADYLAAFCKFRYKNRRFTVIAMSFGFLVVTRMLQRYPELAKKVDLNISLVGFADKSDFTFKPLPYWTLRTMTTVFGRKSTALFLRYVFLQRPMIRLGYWIGERMQFQQKLLDAESKAERNRRISFEVFLWQCNDVRTYMQTLKAMLTIKYKPVWVELPVHHIAVDTDRYFDNVRVEEHMRRIYSDFILYETSMPNHAPSIVATAEEAMPFIPPEVRQILKKEPR